jgi:alkanesulfonate monooxygenase SsuD/methylene tetrahydromethanopterin reductase-like flavin-dependent oxidoreductase (luciferase family)
MWTEEHPTFSGEYFQIDDAAATPRPAIIPPICIGSSGERIGLPLVGRQADMWNTSYHGDEEGWVRKRDIVHASAVEAGRSPSDIEITVTVSGDLPESETASEQWVERLTHLGGLGATYFVMDFGHPLHVEPAIRFAEQVIAPIRAADRDGSAGSADHTAEDGGSAPGADPLPRRTR